MRNIIRNAAKKSLCVFMAWNFLFQNAAPAAAAEQVTYIEDIQLFTAGDTDEAEEYFNRIGYTMADADLNADTSTGKYVYMGYKTTTDRTKAVTDIKMMPMDGGYQTYNYDEVLAYMTSQASKTAATLKKAADDFIAQYNNGSPRAKDAKAGLNLFSVKKVNQLLGDYILSGKADQDFYAELVAKGSSAAVHAVANFLNIGVVPYENDCDEDGSPVTASWAAMVPASPLWARYDEGLTADEESQLANEYEDLAKLLFRDIQQFTAYCENAQTRFRNNGNTFEMSVEIDTIEDAAEQQEKMEFEDTDISYLTAYEMLNEYDFDESTKLGDWFLKIGHMTSETVDLKLLYPVIESMGKGMASLIYMTGFLGAVWNTAENTSNNEFIAAVAKFRKDFGEGSVEVFENLDDEFKGKTFGYTSQAIRKKGAENLPLSVFEKIDEKAENVQQKMKELGFLVGIAYTVIAVASLVAKIGIAVTAPAVATATATSSAFAFFSGMGAFVSGISMVFGIASLVLLAVSLVVVLIVWFMKKNAEENKVDFQSVKPDYFYDAISHDGIDSFVLYQSARDYSGNLPEPKPVTLIEVKDPSQGLVGDLNGGKQWRWVTLCFTKDKYVGSPIIANENGEFFKVVYGNPSPQNGYDSVRYFDERAPGDMNAHCEKNGVHGIYMHYMTEKSRAARVNTPVNMPEETIDSGEEKNYITDVIVGIGKDTAEAKGLITAHKDTFYILDYNLSPGTELYTYLGYKLTTDPKEAITDLRVAPYQGSGEKTPLTYGDVTYKQIDILGYYKGKGSKQNVPQADALYYTDDPNAGSPIEADALHPVADFKDVQDGWEPVSYFGSDMPYNFATTYRKMCNEYITGLHRHYPSDPVFNDMPYVSVYYEPTEKYTSGVKYLSGMVFAGGHNMSGPDEVIVNSGGNDLKDMMESLPRVGKATAVNLGGFASQHQYLYYTWTYNPKRAVSDVAVYQGDTFSTSLPYTMSKPTDGITRNYVSAVCIRQQFSMAANERDLRFVNPRFAYMTYNALLFYQSGDYGFYADTTQRYITDLPDGIDFGYSKMQFLPTGLYINGHAEGLDPLTLDDVVVVTDKNAFSYTAEGTKVHYTITGQTLAGKDVDGQKSYRPIAEMKNPNSEKPFNLSYPASTFIGKCTSYTDGSPCPVYMFLRGQLETKKKYISAISVGSFSRQQYKDTKPDANEAELKAIDGMVNLQAMVGAVAGCEDELIVYNVALKNQNNAWYNKQKNGMADRTPPVDSPAAYLGLTRTDRATDAITGVVLYKSALTLVPETIEVNGASYQCGGTSAPIMIGNDRYYLYYTKNSGAIPGFPITDISLDDIPLISGAATNLCCKEGELEIYGNPNQPVFIHLQYEQGNVELYNKLYIGRGSNERAAMCSLLEQGCVEYVKMDLNNHADGDTVLLGYRTGSNRKEAVYDIIVTNDEPFHPEGIISNGIYYTPASSFDLNAGVGYGAKLYMYYTSPYYAANYNKKNRAATTLPETVFTGWITKLAFAENERVPYTTLLEKNADWSAKRAAAEQTGEIEDYYPWEYVMENGNTARIDLNEGVVYCNGDYCEDSRLYMFARRSDGSVKPAGQITGGYVESTYPVGNVYIRK